MTLAYLTRDCALHLSNGNRSKLRPVIATTPLSVLKRPVVSVESINRHLMRIA